MKKIIASLLIGLVLLCGSSVTTSKSSNLQSVKTCSYENPIFK